MKVLKTLISEMQEHPALELEDIYKRIQTMSENVFNEDNLGLSAEQHKQLLQVKQDLYTLLNLLLPNKY